MSEFHALFKDDISGDLTFPVVAGLIKRQSVTVDSMNTGRTVKRFGYEI